ncbi:MAG: nicotinate-nucleotide adenylyltransferase [Sulfuritalea sp.]|nr:nicotinate-nucleotide adenylyltransferase [Sulfuritalea sp.]MDP1984195.1 nicotinate-nucleotide adenylyltransferase [Sulfuritalea sp.]
MSESAAGALGLFGGTFDPLHVAHLRLALEAREALGLAEVCLIPAGRPALRDAPHCAALDRLAMVRLALADTPGFSVDADEVLQAAGAEPSYTIDTLQRQRRLHGPQRPLVLLLGADAFARLEAWHSWRELFGLAHIAVATRPGHELRVGAGTTPLDGEFAARRGVAADLASAPAGRIVPFAITALEISASAIRQRLASGLSVRYLVPEAVLDYIDSHQLYRTSHGH